MWVSASMRTRLEDSIAQARVTMRALEGHMAECDRRYDQLARDQETRHNENSHRMDRQDSILYKLLWGVVVAAVSTVGILVETLVRALNVHIGAG